jgi:4-carboxymuconolactone decarboxylase
MASPVPPSAPRIAPLTPPYEATAADVLARFPSAPGIEEPLALFRTWAVHPGLAEALRPWGGFLLSRRAALPLRDRELVIDRACARCGSEYEWGVHVSAFASAAGFTDDEVRIVARCAPGDAAIDGLAARDRAIVRMVDALHDGADVPDDVWSPLAAMWTPAQCIEAVMLAGWYRTIGAFCRALRVPIESWEARFPDLTRP